MKREFHQGAFAGLLISSLILAVGCFGPFKKKSSDSGGGGGGGEEEVAEDGEEGTETPSGGTTPASGSGSGSGSGSPSAGVEPGTGSGEPETPPLPGQEAGHGCLQGVIVDGFTGQPIDITSHLENIFVLIRDKKLKAAGYDHPNLVGQYYICGIPVEDTYPVFAFIDGYFDFESSVIVDSTRAVRVSNDQAVTDEVAIPDPLEMKDIALFPKATGDRDLAVRAYHEGKPVKDVIVDLEPVDPASDHFNSTGTFAYTKEVRLWPQRATTNAEGIATFAAETIALGHKYKVRATAPAGSDLIAPAHADIILGISGATEDVDANNWLLNLDFADAGEGLMAISCSRAGETYNSAGTIQIVFNREIQLTSNDDDWFAQLKVGAAAPLASGATTPSGAKLPHNNSTLNGKSETMTATIQGGNTLVLKALWDAEDPDGGNDGVALKSPNYAKAFDDTDNEDIDVSIVYPFSAITVATKGDNTNNSQSLTDLAAVGVCGATSIRFFREYGN